MADDVQLPDLEVIARYSLAVRAATAPREDVVAALEADLAWLKSSRPAPRTRRAPEQAAPRRPAVRRAPRRTAPAEADPPLVVDAAPEPAADPDLSAPDAPRE